MELGLSLGDASKPLRFLKENKPANKTGLDFCMALGLSSPAINGNQQREKTHKTQENDQDKDGDGDDEDGDDDDDGDESDDDDDDPNLQLNLLPLAPIPLQICSRPWSSDNGSSENGSSGNLGIPAARGFDVNKLPAAGEEVSSANSPFSLYRNTRNGNLPLGGGGNKRDLEATLNDAARALSDDDENALNARKKLRLSKEQSAFLEESFKEHNTLNPKQKLALAKQLNLRPRQVEVWFQNRRARTKLKQTEVDCEYLKRCCETLTEENRRLNKELQELRALKTSNPFYMQLPATTLTMCPSCERVTTAAKTTAAAADTAAPKAKAASPFPQTRPRFYPFSQSPTSPNQPAPS